MRLLLLLLLLLQILDKGPDELLPPPTVSPLQRQVQRTVGALLGPSGAHTKGIPLQVEAEHKVGCLYTVDVLLSRK